jgi:dTDP-4-dehydrorhamnose reductase
MKMAKSMKVNEMFKSIEPMVAQLEKGTALFMIGSEDKKDSGIIREKAVDIINMLVNQMIRDEHIERIIMVAAQAFIDYAEHQKKPANNPNIS